MLTIKKYLIKEDENVRIVNNPGKSPLYEDGVLPTKRAKHTLSKFRHEKSRFLLLGVASGKCGFTTLSCCNRQVEMVTYIIFSPSLRYHHSMLKT